MMTTVDAAASTRPSPPPSANLNKALWEKGDFTRIARTMRESGDALVRAIGVKPGMQVLDLGCGDGTTAIPAAQLGASVLGVHIAANLVRAGKLRAQEAGLANCHFAEGDACALDALADASFDLSVSIFGAMFAPRPFDVARELVRVTRPGGRIVMGNWIPDDPTLVAQILKISAAYTPPPPAGFISPMTWGIEEKVVERFALAGISADRVGFVRDTFTFRAQGAPAGRSRGRRRTCSTRRAARSASTTAARAGSRRTAARSWRASTLATTARTPTRFRGCCFRPSRRAAAASSAARSSSSASTRWAARRPRPAATRPRWAWKRGCSTRRRITSTRRSSEGWVVRIGVDCCR